MSGGDASPCRLVARAASSLVGTGLSKLLERWVLRAFGVLFRRCWPLKFLSVGCANGAEAIIKTMNKFRGKMGA